MFCDEMSPVLRELKTIKLSSNLPSRRTDRFVNTNIQREFRFSKFFCVFFQKKLIYINMKYLKEMDDWATSNKLGDYELPKGNPNRDDFPHIREFMRDYNRTFVELPVGGDIFDEINHLCYLWNIDDDDLLEIIEGHERGDYTLPGIDILKEFYSEM
jgi:hypothetical protein